MRGLYGAFGNYNDTITLGQLALDGAAPHGHTQLIVGLSYLRAGDYNAATNHVGQALHLGERLQIPVKHFHKQGRGEGLCAGVMTLRRGFLEFHSDEVAADNFSVPLYKASGLRVDWDKGGRVLVQIMLPKGKKEAPFAYSFHPAQAYLRRKEQNKANSPTLVDCSDCQPAVQLLYQLIAQLGR